MGENHPDDYRDRKTIEQLKSIAVGIFQMHGVDFGRVKRAGGWSNATWLGEGLALRMAVRQGNETIRREAQLAGLLPGEVGYPHILDCGITNGYEWCLSKELAGRNLDEVWPELSWDERGRALRQMWKKAQAVHTIDLSLVQDLARKRAWFNSNNAEEANASLERLVRGRILTRQQVDVLRGNLDCFWEVLPKSVHVLNHGDLTMGNTIWDQGEVTALLDFEFAVIAPPELDLNVLAKNAFFPDDNRVALTDLDQQGKKILRKAFAELAEPLLVDPRGRILLTGYAILLELWMLEDWLAHPEGEGPLENWEPYRRLGSLADIKGSYLSELFQLVEEIKDR